MESYYLLEDLRVKNIRTRKRPFVRCGSEVYVMDIEDENLKGLYGAYRQKNGIISLEKIQRFRRSTISKRPLSLLLGWK